MKINQQSFRPTLNLSALPPQEPFKKKRVPGRLRTSTECFNNPPSIDELLVLNSSRKITNDHIYQQMQQIINSLLTKNQQLLTRNTALSNQNTSLNNKIQQLQEKIICLLARQNQSKSLETQFLMEYFNSLSDNPLIKLESNVISEIEGDMCVCRDDNNSNIRAFYLSMLQTSSTRELLSQLIMDFQNDESWKLVPLLSTNETWVHLTENFLRVLDSNQFIDLEQIVAFFNQSQLYDIILVSAIRARVQFLGEGYNSYIDTKELYMAFENIFIKENVELQYRQTEQYDKYIFKINDQELVIYYIESLNKYGIYFDRVQGVCQKSQMIDRLQQLQIEGEIDSYNTYTPLSTQRKSTFKGMYSKSESSSVIKRIRLGSERYCQMEQDDD